MPYTFTEPNVYPNMDALLTPDGQYKIVIGDYGWLYAVPSSDGKSFDTPRNWSNTIGQFEKEFDNSVGDYTCVGSRDGIAWTLHKSGLDLVAYRVPEIILDYAGPKPVSPVLNQGKYEGKSDFAARVNQAEKTYKDAVRSYNDRLNSAPNSEIMEAAFTSVFENPKVGKTDYDSDSQSFFVDILPTGEKSGGFAIKLKLKDAIPSSEANAFDRKLTKAQPIIQFLATNGSLSVVSAELIVAGKSMAAIAVSGETSNTLAQVDVGKMATDLQVPASPEASMKYENPATKDAIKPIVSDVDKPEYSAKENPNAFAVIIGIEKYVGLPAADFAERDAAAVRAHLTALGYPPRNIYFLGGQQATRAKIDQALNTWLPKRVSNKSTVFFYYSGHGAPDPRTNQAYLVPVDGDAEDLDSTAYPIKQLYAKLGSLKARHVIVALDSCFSGAGGRSVLANGTRPLVSQIDLGVLPGNVIALTASDKNEISGTIENQGHGAFTYYLLKGLGGEAKNDSGHVTVQSLYDYLTPKVQDAARLHNRDQTPQLLPAGGKIQGTRLR